MTCCEESGRPLANNTEGHCQLALTLHLGDLICFTLLNTDSIPRQTGFRLTGGGQSFSPLWHGPYFEKQNTLIFTILFLQIMPLSPWTTAKDGMEVRRGESYVVVGQKHCFNSLQDRFQPDFPLSGQVL